MRVISFLILLSVFNLKQARGDSYLPGFSGENRLKLSEESEDAEDIFIPQKESEILKEVRGIEGEEGVFYDPKAKAFDPSREAGGNEAGILSGRGGEVDIRESDDDFLRANPGHVLGQNLKTNFKGRLREVKKYGRSNFSFQYFKNKYKYTSPGKSFDQTFRESPESISPFLIQIGGNKIISKSFGQFLAGFRFSIGYMSGRGYFKNSDGTLDPNPSKTRMIFWTLPLDFALGYDLPIGNFIKIGGAAGPSGMILVQNRSDSISGEVKRNNRRLGYGYFYEGNIKFELLRLFSDGYTRKVFNQYSMTNTFLTFSVKKVFYNRFSNSQSKFPSDKSIKIEGLSYGAGLTYEFF